MSLAKRHEEPTVTLRSQELEFTGAPQDWLLEMARRCAQTGPLRDFDVASQTCLEEEGRPVLRVLYVNPWG